MPVAPQRILLATIGSLGDLHPCIALALELQRRGHVATIASTEFYRAKLEDLGIGEFGSSLLGWKLMNCDVIVFIEHANGDQLAGVPVQRVAQLL